MPFSVTIWVAGTPAPMGSSWAKCIAAWKAIVVRQGDAEIRKWQRAIKLVASRVAPAEPLDCPVRVVLEFALERPKKPKFATAPAARLDADKMARSTLDALTGSLYRDDSRVVQLLVSKVWAGESGEGATITVEELSC